MKWRKYEIKIVKVKHKNSGTLLKFIVTIVTASGGCSECFCKCLYLIYDNRSLIIHLIILVYDCCVTDVTG